MVFLLLLGCGDIFSIAGTNTEDVRESRRHPKIREAHKMPFALKSNGQRDTSKWRLAKFSDICAISKKRKCSYGDLNRRLKIVS